jgi:hypothetical protein
MRTPSRRSIANTVALVRSPMTAPMVVDGAIGVLEGDWWKTAG